MAIELKISHENRLVVATVNAGTRRGDYMKMLAGIAAENAISYRKIVDIRFTPPDYKVSDFRAFGESVLAWGKDDKPGPTALIVASDIVREFADLFRAHSRVDRPLRAFSDMADARAWLDDVAPV